MTDTAPEVGESPTPNDLMWMGAGQQLTPDKSLQRVQDSAKLLIGSVGIVGILLTGFGFLAGSSLRAAWIGLAAAIVITAASLFCAFMGLILQSGRVQPNNLWSVEQWYRHQLGWRGGWVRMAGLLFIAALLVAAATAASAVQPQSGAKELALIRQTSGSSYVVAVHVGLTGLPDGSTANVQVTEGSDSNQRLVLSEIAQTDSSGAFRLDEGSLPDPGGLEVGIRLEVTVNGHLWLRRQASLPNAKP